MNRHAPDKSVWGNWENPFPTIETADGFVTRDIDLRAGTATVMHVKCEGDGYLRLVEYVSLAVKIDPPVEQR